VKHARGEMRNYTARIWMDYWWSKSAAQSTKF
jgi:hypothetical protein